MTSAAQCKSQDGYITGQPYMGPSSEVCDDCITDNCNYCQISGRCVQKTQLCPVTQELMRESDGQSELRASHCQYPDKWTNSLHTLETNIIYGACDEATRVAKIHPSFSGVFDKGGAVDLTIHVPSDATDLDICLLPNWASLKTTVIIDNTNNSPNVDVSSVSNPVTLASCTFSEYSHASRVKFPNVALGGKRGNGGNVTLAALQITAWPYTGNLGQNGVVHRVTIVQYPKSYQHCPSITSPTPNNNNNGNNNNNNNGGGTNIVSNTPSGRNSMTNNTLPSNNSLSDDNIAIIVAVVLSIVLSLFIVFFLIYYFKKRKDTQKGNYGGNPGIALTNRQRKSRAKYNGYKGGAVKVVLHDDDDSELPGIGKEQWTKHLVSSLGTVNMGMIIDFNTVKLGKKIASGGGGQVYTAIWRDTEVVVKEPFWFCGTNSQDLIHEIQMLAELDHPNVVRFFGVSHAERKVYLITEYCELGSLNDWLQEKKFPWASFYPCAKQLMDTLHWLHEVGVVHRDIKPHNILMSSTESIKICDLGTCRNQANSGMSMTANVGTLSYTPPEVMSSKRAIYDGRKWDVYSSSLCLYYMFTGSKPFGSKSNFEIISGVANENGLRPDWLDCDMPDELWILLELMWEEDPDHRPLCSQVSTQLNEIQQKYSPDSGNGGDGGGSGGSSNSNTSNTKNTNKPELLPKNTEWEAHYDANHGQTFYHNKNSKRTTWTNPTTNPQEDSYSNPLNE